MKEQPLSVYFVVEPIDMSIQQNLRNECCNTYKARMTKVRE